MPRDHSSLFLFMTVKLQSLICMSAKINLSTFRFVFHTLRFDTNKGFNLCFWSVVSIPFNNFMLLHCYMLKRSYSVELFNVRWVLKLLIKIRNCMTAEYLAMGRIMSIVNDFTRHSSKVSKTIYSLDLGNFEWCNNLFSSVCQISGITSALVLR